MNCSHARLNVSTPAGTYTLEASERGLFRVSCPGRGGKAAGSTKAREQVRKARMAFKAYFKGKPGAFDRLRLDTDGFSCFQKEVLGALARVPYGSVVTYSELAKAAGHPKAVRAVGSVMRKNRLPVVLPCHRVIRSCGSLGQYAQGPERKEFLLRHERDARGLGGGRTRAIMPPSATLRKK